MVSSGHRGGGRKGGQQGERLGSCCTHVCAPTLPRLVHVLDAVTAGPAAELLVAQLSGLPLHRLSLAGYRMLPGLLGSVAEALPALRELALAVEQVEGSGRLELAALPRLQGLQELELRVLPGRASVPDVTVAPLPGEASCLNRLTSLALLHVRPGQGEEGALWGSLAHLPVLQQLRFEQSGHAVRQPPPQLLQLESLTSLHVQVGGAPARCNTRLGARRLNVWWCADPTQRVLLRRPNTALANHVHPHSFLPPAEQIDGAIYGGDLPGSTWTQLPELPDGALPRLACLQLECVGLLGLPASWCR